MEYSVPQDFGTVKKVKRATENAVKVFLWTSAVMITGAVAILLLFLLKKGAPGLSLKLVFGDADPLRALFLQERVFNGIFPAIVGSFLVVFLSVTWAIPLGVLTGIYMAEYGNGHLKKILDFSFDLLASVPSIVIGLFGLTLAIFLHRNFSQRLYPCLLISSFSLAILIIPYIVRTTQLSIEEVSVSTKLAGLSLGASKIQNLLYVIMPASVKGILSGVVLAMGRAAEDTAVIMLTGVVATAGIPNSLLSKFEALPFYIYYISSQYSDQAELVTGFAAAIILLTVCGTLFSFAHVLKNVLVGKDNGF